MNNKEFDKLAYALNSKKKEEVFSFDFENKKYWLKKARPTKSKLIQKILYKLFPIVIVLPVENKSAKNSLEFETNKIIRLKQKGIHTPNIKIKNENFFVLEDSGKNVHSYIKKRDINKEKMYYYIDLMLNELALIHNSDEYHGGSQSRNFIYKNGNITTIDFEDSFDKDTDLKILQFRDLVLFLLSLTKTRASFELDYDYILTKYINLVPKNKEFKQNLVILANKISFLIFISQNIFVKKIMGRDVKGFFKLFLILQNLKG